MTLASEVITRAFRETNLIPLGQSPTTNQSAEGLYLLNSLLLSTVGNEVGDGFDDLNIGGTYDRSDLCATYVPDDVRLMLNLSAAKTLLLDPNPYEGQRLSFVDIKGNLATYNLTLNPNGRLIEGATTLVLSVNSDARQWMYRSDTGNWVKILALATSDTMPFPVEFDSYFVIGLAMRLNPRFSQQMTQESIEALKRARAQLRARYHNYKQMRPDLNTKGFLSDPYGVIVGWGSNGFNTGKTWPYL